MTDAIRELFELLTKKEKSGSDYTGTVTKVDGKTAYVKFDGSDITDTPVALSIGAKAGDSVRVRVADGRAWLVGNDDAPPNDSSEVGYELALTNALIRQLTTEQINGENGWINLLKGTFNYGNRLIWNGSILSLIGKIETSEGKVAGWVIGASTISSGAKGANTALVTLKSGASGSITVENIYFKSLLDYNGLAMTGDYGETQLTNTGLDIRRKYIGDTTWVHTYITGGTVQVGDSPNQTIIGEGTGDFSGSISEGGTTLAQKYMGMEVANGYWGLKPNGSNAVYVRTTQNGLIPYQSGGSGTLGTSSWPFSTIYGSTIYEGGTALSSKYLGLGGGTLTGGLTVSGGAVNVKAGNVRAAGTSDVFAYAENTTSKCYAAMRSSSNGWHGLYSNGYWNGSAYTASASWFCLRDTSGKWQIANGTTVNGSFSVSGALKGYNEGYSTLRPVVGTNAGTNAVGVIVSNSASFGIYGRWGGGASAAMSGRTISCPASDIRLKKNIKDSEADALSVINAIRIRQFDWKDPSRGHWDCGMIVDEMERDIDPNFCIGGEEDEDGNPSYKSVDTFYLQGYEVKAIQELSKRIEELERRLAS